MLKEQQVQILRDISQSIAFADDKNGQRDALILEGYMKKDGDLFELTPKGVMVLEEYTNVALQQGERT
jgi:hypothetical protein